MKLAIVGIGCLFPKAGNLGAYWSLLKNGLDAITPIPPTHWNPSDYFDSDPKKPDSTYAQRGGFLEPYPFAPGDFGIAPNDLEATDTSQLLGMVAAQMALRDAGYGPERQFDRSRVSVVLGVTGTLELVVPLGARLGHPHWRRAMQDAGVPANLIDDAVKRIGESYVGWQENSFPGLLGNVVAGRIANRLDLHGTNCVVDAACASSLSAMHLASLELSAGRSDVVVTGGVDTFNDIFMYMCFSKTPALSPTGDARPFSSASDGTILGEGLGLVVLKRLDDAERDGDRIYAVIRGIGTSSDGKGNAIYAPSAEGQTRCLNDAYAQAEISPSTIDMVEAHGTGTKVGDATELAALNSVFQASRQRSRLEESTPTAVAPDSPWCALGSVKSQIGHTKAAAGAAGLIKAALSLHHKVLPPTIKVEQPAESIAPGATPFYVNTIKRPWLPRDHHPRRAGVSAFGFGGSNFHAVLEEHHPRKPGIDWDGSVQIAAFSGETIAAIKNQLGTWDTLDWDGIARRSSELRASFRPDSQCRLVLVFSKDSDIGKVLASARNLLDAPPGESFAFSSDGSYFGRGSAPGKLGVLFPGQGSQYVGMMRDLACQFPDMLDVLTEANTAFAERSNSSHERLSDFIYPFPAFSAEQFASNERALRATHVAQPAIGAVSLGAMRVLNSFGVRPDAAAGHSYGELTALCAAGCYDQPALHSLSRLRGQLMAEVREGDPGSMLAVHAPVGDIERAIREEQLDLVIANRNAPMQSVLSGSTREIERAGKILSSRQLRSTRLPVAAAFHSTLVANAERPFRDALERIRVQASRVPVYSNSTGQPYPVDPDAIRELLAGQLARPVNFVQEIVGMIRAGVRTFLEVGPGAVLTRLVESTVKEHAATDGVDCIALDASGGKRDGILDLAHLLARLAARGHGIELNVWEQNPPHPVPRRTTDRPTLTVPICGANYVKPRTKRAPSPIVVAPAAPVVSAAPPVSPTSAPQKITISTPRIAPVTAPQQQPPPSSALAQALQLTQEGMTAFQRLQEQTAQLHSQFLQHQETAQQSLQRLIEQQQQLLLASVSVEPIRPAAAASMQPVIPPPTIPRSAPAQPRNEVVLPTAPLLQAVVAPTPTAPVVQKSAEPINGRARVERVLLEVVSDKTGYPAEMLNAEMGLDADLGIDSIKRVEILSALQEKLPEAPAVKPEHLGTLNTLGQIIDFLAVGANGPPAIFPPRESSTIVEPAAVSAASTAVGGSGDRNQVQHVLMEVVSQKTGYPVEMLNPEMGLDADLGIDSIKRVEILSALQEKLPAAPAVKPEHLGTLSTLGQIVDFLTAGTTPAPAASPTSDAMTTRQTLRSTPVPFESDRPVVTLPAGAVVALVAGADPLADHVEMQVRARGVQVQRFYWDAPVTVPENTAGLLLIAPLLTDLPTLATAFRWLRASGPSLRASAGRSFFTTVSRLDGQFGLKAIDTTMSPESGGLSGLAKTANHEWAEVSCKAIDAARHGEPSRLASRIASELFVRGPVEVGIDDTGISTIQLAASPRPPIDAKLLTPDDIIVISGGARGVTAATAIAFAETYRATLVLLGRSPFPEEEPDWLRGLVDEREIKRALSTRLQGSVSPREINRRFQQLAAGREVRDTLRRIAAAGSRVAYHSVDVRESDVVAAVLAQVRDELGPITGLIHGAGVIEDRLILDKTDEQFDRVVGTKVEGLMNLLHALEQDDLKVLAMFSSSTGRFGRSGQCDYAVANEVLNKIARREAACRPACRVVSVNWGPWEGGMVTPDLARMFEQEGVGLIPLPDGARFLIEELSSLDRPLEVVAGVWLDKPAAPVEAEVESAPAMMDASLSPVWERDVDVESHGVLADHVIDGRAVVPLALQMEWLMHAALHGNPGLTVSGIDDLRVLNGIKIGAGESRRIRALAGKARKTGGDYHVTVELRSERGDGRPVVHTRSQVVLAAKLLDDSPHIHVGSLQRYSRKLEDCYRETLFHGPALQGLVRLEGISSEGIAAWSATAPAPGAWMSRPPRAQWLADPLVIDAAFQLAILWGMELQHQSNLPMAFSRYRQFRRTFPSGKIRIVIKFMPVAGPVIRADVEWLDSDEKLVARLEGGEFVGDAKLAVAFRRNRLPLLPA